MDAKAIGLKSFRWQSPQMSEESKISSRFRKSGKTPLSSIGQPVSAASVSFSALFLFKSCLQLRILKCFIRFRSTYKMLCIFKPVYKTVKRLKYILMALSNSATILFKTSRHQCTSFIIVLTWIPDYFLSFSIACSPVVYEHTYIWIIKVFS